jgi:hypothetical protein
MTPIPLTDLIVSPRNLSDYLLLGVAGSVSIAGYFVDSNDSPIVTGSVASYTGTISNVTAQTLATCLGLAALPDGAWGFNGELGSGTIIIGAGAASRNAGVIAADMVLNPGNYPQQIGPQTNFILGRAG